MGNERGCAHRNLPGLVAAWIAVGILGMAIAAGLGASPVATVVAGVLAMPALVVALAIVAIGGGGLAALRRRIVFGRAVARLRALDAVEGADEEYERTIERMRGAGDVDPSPVRGLLLGDDGKSRGYLLAYLAGRRGDEASRRLLWELAARRDDPMGWRARKALHR